MYVDRVWTYWRFKEFGRSICLLIGYEVIEDIKEQLYLDTHAVCKCLEKYRKFRKEKRRGDGGSGKYNCYFALFFFCFSLPYSIFFSLFPTLRCFFFSFILLYNIFFLAFYYFTLFFFCFTLLHNIFCITFHYFTLFISWFTILNTIFTLPYVQI